MRSRIIVCAVLAAVVIIPIGDAGAARAAGASCAPLKRLLSLADSQFVRLRGYYDRRLERWVATYRMQGATLCTVEETDGIGFYSCKWIHDPQAGTVPDAYVGLLEQVTGCLKIGETMKIVPGPDQEAIRLAVAGTHKTIVVGRSESSSAGHFVSVDVVPFGLQDFPDQ